MTIRHVTVRKGREYVCTVSNAKRVLATIHDPDPAIVAEMLRRFLLPLRQQKGKK